MSDSTMSPVVVSTMKEVAPSVRSSSGRFWKPSTVAPSPCPGEADVKPTSSDDTCVLGTAAHVAKARVMACWNWSEVTPGTPRSVTKYRIGRLLTQGWKTFLRNHADGIAAMDLFVVPTVSFRLLYGLLIMRYSRRQILWFGVTAHPTAERLANQLTEACGWGRAPEFLIRDSDACYGATFMRRGRSLGIRDHPTSARSPWQNGYAERLIGSLRRECLDHVVVLGERHLRHVLGCYADYYNGVRTHLSLAKDAPRRRAVQAAGLIEALPILGGLHHQYVRI